jgi:hypothetical protein
MNINSVRNTRINRLAVLALLILCFSQLPIRAWGQHQSGSGKVQMADFLHFGLVPDEMARITVANVPDNPVADGPISAQLTLFNAEGTEIYKSPEVVIPVGQFRWMDVKREQLSDRGDSLTGRLQVLGKVILWVRDVTVNPLPVADPIGSFEVIKTSTGATTLGRSIGLRHEHTRPE